MLSSTELHRLERGIPDLWACGNELLVPFAVRRLAHPKLLWTNRRWFAARGFDLSVPAQREKIGSWLLNEFAFAVKDSRDPDHAFLAPAKTVHADRYGTTGLGRHGGSARVMTIGKFQVKGIGRTPLTGVNVKWDHSQGWCGLEEAISEALFGELVDEEFPFGGNPVIAIIDAGLLQHPQGELTPKYRRALIVRPSVVRPAHMLRAPLFANSIHGPQSHHVDVRRTFDAIRWFQGLADEERVKLGLPRDLQELASRLAHQAAFSEVFRIFSGGMFASNVSLTGALLDFGATTAVRTWGNAVYPGQGPGFGRDIKVLGAAFKELSLYFSKATGFEVSSALLIDVLEQEYRRRFDEYLLRLAGDCSTAERRKSRQPVAQTLRALFDTQQTHSWFMEDSLATWQKGPDWFVCHPLTYPVGELRPEPDGGLRRQFPRSLLDPAPQLMVRNLAPLHCLDKQQITYRLRTSGVVSGDDRFAPDAGAVARFIDDTLQEGRRYWPRLPDDIRVLEFAYLHGCSAVRGVRSGTGEQVLWLEGLFIEQRATFFGADVDADLANEGLAVGGANRWTITLPNACLHRLPQIAEACAAPSLRWTTT